MFIDLPELLPGEYHADIHFKVTEFTGKGGYSGTHPEIVGEPIINAVPASEWEWHQSAMVITLIVAVVWLIRELNLPKGKK